MIMIRKKWTKTGHRMMHGLFEVSADESADSKNYVRKIKLESKSGFINFEGKNSINVIFVWIIRF